MGGDCGGATGAASEPVPLRGLTRLRRCFHHLSVGLYGVQDIGVGDLSCVRQKECARDQRRHVQAVACDDEHPVPERIVRLAGQHVQQGGVTRFDVHRIPQQTGRDGQNDPWFRVVQ